MVIVAGDGYGHSPIEYDPAGYHGLHVESGFFTPADVMIVVSGGSLIE